MMKARNLFILLFLSIRSLNAQKLYSDFYAFSTDRDSILIKTQSLSDADVQRKFPEFLIKQPTKFQNAAFVKEGDNRYFDRFTLNHTPAYLRLLVKGHYNLYINKQKGKDAFLITSQSDTIQISQKEDRIDGSKIREDTRYAGMLIFLTKDFPDLHPAIRKSKFTALDIQSIIAGLNRKFTDTNTISYPVFFKRDFFHVNLLGFYIRNSISERINLLMDMMVVKYYLDLSRNFSVRVGLNVSYFKETDPSSFYRISEFKYVGIPILFNEEFTNNFITPYVYFGFMPILYNAVQTSTDRLVKNAVALSFRGGLGIKLKFSDSFNAVSEFKYESITSLNLVVGVQYNFKRATDH